MKFRDTYTYQKYLLEIFRKRVARFFANYE